MDVCWGEGEGGVVVTDQCTHSPRSSDAVDDVTYDSRFSQCFTLLVHVYFVVYIDNTVRVAQSILSVECCVVSSNSSV